MKLLVGGFAHETNTFSSKPTTVADFRLPGCWTEGESLYDMRGTNTEIGGFIEESEARGIDLVMTLATNAAPMGRVVDEMVDVFLDRLYAGFDEHPDVDGGTPSHRSCSPYMYTCVYAPQQLCQTSETNTVGTVTESH